MNELIEYVRNKKRTPIGVVVAKLVPQKDFLPCIGIGWSMANKKAGDKFDREVGLDLARARCEYPSKKQIPYSVAKVMNRMNERSKKYFKDISKSN